jgi:hypothetical protein
MIILKKVPRSEWHEEMGILAKTSRASIKVRRNIPGGGWNHTILDRKAVVIAYCPKCGMSGYLDDHTISADGAVFQSLRCPHPPCDFDDQVQLENYEA